MNTRMSSAVVTVVVTASVLSGCASSQRGLEPRDYWPSGARWKQAASRALKDRGTWIPLAGAAVVSIDDWDREVSDWAVENTPIFGSNGSISGIVYGLEYAHTFFMDRKFALLAGYGLQFNQVRLSASDGYSYGHHTKLALGGIYNAAAAHKLAASINYNFVAFPYFETSESKHSFVSLGLRYIYMM